MLYFLFSLLAVLWSASFLAIKISLLAFTPIFGALLRVGIALSALTLFFGCSRTPLKLPLKTAALLWMQGIIAQGLAFVFLFWGEQYIAPALASIINSTVPLWVILINGVILQKKHVFSVKTLLGLLLGFIGILCIFVPLVSIANNWMTLWGTLSVVCMAISYAIGAILYQKMFSPPNIVPFKASIWHQHIGSFTFLLLFSLLSGNIPTGGQLIWNSTNLHSFLAILYLGLFSTAIAWMIYSHLIVKWGAVRAVTVLYLVPVFAVIWDMIFLHLTFQYYDFFGVGAILIGLIFVQRASSIPK